MDWLTFAKEVKLMSVQTVIIFVMASFVVYGWYKRKIKNLEKEIKNNKDIVASYTVAQKAFKELNLCDFYGNVGVTIGNKGISSIGESSEMLKILQNIASALDIEVHKSKLECKNSQS